MTMPEPPAEAIEYGEELPFPAPPPLPVFVAPAVETALVPSAPSPPIPLPPVPFTPPAPPPPPA